jgi:hypothetical protein
LKTKNPSIAIHCTLCVLSASDVSRNPDENSLMRSASNRKQSPAKPISPWVLSKNCMRSKKNSSNKTANECYKIRQALSLEVIEKLRQWLEKTLQNSPPKTTLGKAIHYLHKQSPILIAYVENGNWPMDNNRCENTIHPFVIDRKTGTLTSAKLYSLTETAKANGGPLYVLEKAVHLTTSS